MWIQLYYQAQMLYDSLLATMSCSHVPTLQGCELRLWQQTVNCGQAPIWLYSVQFSGIRLNEGFSNVLALEEPHQLAPSAAEHFPSPLSTDVLIQRLERLNQLKKNGKRGPCCMLNTKVNAYTSSLFFFYLCSFVHHYAAHADHMASVLNSACHKWSVHADKESDAQKFYFILCKQML